jgi:4-hydroxy-4-methyl-2-oxoglutarate aldolase
MLSEDVSNAMTTPPTAAIHDEQGHIGDLPNRVRSLCPGSYLKGPAYPVRLAPASNIWLHRAIYRAPTGSVLVVATADCGPYGYFGEVLLAAAIQQGIEGIVIDGGIRDVGLLRQAQFPVFHTEVSMRGTTKELGDGSAGLPVAIGSTCVGLGDLVVGDDDGVVIVPIDQIDAVIDRAVARELRDAELVAKIRSGVPLYELTGRSK